MKCAGSSHEIDHVRRPEKLFCWRSLFDNRARYKVEVMGYGGGYFEWFHRLKSAEAYFEKYKSAGPRVELLDMWYHHVGCNCWNTPGFRLRFQDNRQAMPAPEFYPPSREVVQQYSSVIWPVRPEFTGRR